MANQNVNVFLFSSFECNLRRLGAHPNSLNAYRLYRRRALLAVWLVCMACHAPAQALERTAGGAQNWQVENTRNATQTLGAVVGALSEEVKALQEEIELLKKRKLPHIKYFSENSMFIVPEGVEKVKVVVAGAGGGGGSSEPGADVHGKEGGATTVQGKQLFIQALGGEGGRSGSYTGFGPVHGSAVVTTAHEGKLLHQGGGAVGGTGFNNEGNDVVGFQGGSGGYAEAIFSVRAGMALQIDVGKGGRGANDNKRGHPGSDGYALIVW